MPNHHPFAARTTARRGRERLRAALAAAACAAAGSALAGHDAPADLALEELLNARVQTASRKDERVHDVAAAVYLITRDDISRSGATTLPEALRLAPGLHVVQLANNRWVVATRGFGGRFANKLLVLIDGRSVYSTLFGGVLWENESTLIEDIERIEVIRGPGAALWGANAVNGVINVITRHARDTAGTLVAGVAGQHGRQLVARQGFRVAGGDVRLWARATELDATSGADGQPGNDWASERRIGLRGDWSFDRARRLTVSAQVYRSPTGDTWYPVDLRSPTLREVRRVEQGGQGGHLLARHEWITDGGSEVVLQGYLDHSRVGLGDVADDRRTTADLDFQHRLHATDAHELVWGLGWREQRDTIDSSGFLHIEPRHRPFRLGSAFVQDEWTLVPDRLKAVAGARYEHNNVSGGKVLPNLRLAWTPDTRTTVWAAASRAVRSPSRSEIDTSIDISAMPAAANRPPVLVRLLPPPAHTLSDERVQSVELGWRQQILPTLSLDAALFNARYSDLRTTRSGLPSFEMTPVPHVVQLGYIASVGNARARGGEVSVDWHPDPHWRVQGSYSRLLLQAWHESTDPLTQGGLGNLESMSPNEQWQLRASYTPLPQWRFDGWLRHTGALPTVASRPGVAAFTALDLRMAWRPQPGLEVSLLGQNLTDAKRVEFHPDFIPAQTILIDRTVAVRVSWSF